MAMKAKQTAQIRHDERVIFRQQQVGSVQQRLVTETAGWIRSRIATIVRSFSPSTSESVILDSVTRQLETEIRARAESAVATDSAYFVLRLDMNHYYVKTVFLIGLKLVQCAKHVFGPANVSTVIWTCIGYEFCWMKVDRV